MGDAAVNHHILSPRDVGQSSFGANSSLAAAGGGFVALDVGALSSLAGDAGPPPGTPTAPPRTPTAPPRTPKVVRSLSRKGDRKPADGDANGTAGRRWRAAAAVRARGGRRPRGRARQRAAGRAHAAGQHSGEKVPAVRQPAGAVAGSPEGGLPLRHAVQRGDADPALLHAVHEQGGVQWQRWWRRQRRSVKLRPPTAKGGFLCCSEFFFLNKLTRKRLRGY